MTRFVPIVLLLAACTEYNINEKKADPKPGDTAVDTGEPDTGDTDTGDPPVDEECNGVDDDGDGQVDEDFEDIDGDGTADCIDEDCEVEVPAAGLVDVLEECVGVGAGTVTDPWNVGIEWQYTSAGNGVIVMPAVGNLTDDNADGVVDENDIPDIAFTTWSSNTLVALSGDGSGEIFAVTNIDPDGSVPSPAPLSWQVHNVFRARPTVDEPGSPDLLPLLGDLCVASCDDGPVKVTWAISNQGGVDVDAGVPVTLYTVHEGVEVLFETQSAPEVLAGTTAPGGTFTLGRQDWGDGIVLRVDDVNGAQTQTECDEDNNSVEYLESFCGW